MKLFFRQALLDNQISYFAFPVEDKQLQILSAASLSAFRQKTQKLLTGKF